MADSFFVDESGLRATVAELRRLAAEGSQMLADLQNVVDHQGQPWGTDETGAQFARNYVPDAQRGMQNLRDLVASLHGFGDRVAASAEAFDQQDALGGTALGRADFGADNASAPVDTAPAPTTGGTPFPDPVTPGTASPAVPVPSPGTAPAATRSGLGTPETTAGPRPMASGQSAAQPNSAQSRDPRADDPARQSESAAPHSDSRSDPRTGDIAAEADPRTDPAAAASAPEHSDPARPKGNSAAAESRSRTPWSARGATSTPWAEPTGGVPGNEPAPRVSPPRRADRPPRPARPAPSKRTGRRSTPERAVPRADTSALRILREAAARHGLALSGFDTCGIGPDAARELVAALDAVLPKCPGLLHGLDVDGRPGPRSRVEARDTPGDRPALWIVLDPDAMPDTALFGNAAGATAAVAEIGGTRPLYVTIVREIGAALAISVGEPVRRRVQRALIAEYLRIRGARADPLSEVVTGYRRWRERLGASCFDRGVLRPGVALGEGFAEVELCGDAAGAPARVLHRLALLPATRT
ncbi:hypothetical protein [Nocardia sp. BMG111209]|uniref:hypothetical protein n=1 Tax=Nocardia sp. BMG111209 TaxID=1160137 RepID=UPI00039DEB1A|nr:hypothetical protein [Nocardia sp. BMG111209]